MAFDLPPVDYTPAVTVQVVCEQAGCIDSVTAFVLCGEVVFVGPWTSRYYVMPGVACSALPGPMSGVKQWTDE